MLHVLQSLSDGTTQVVDAAVPLATGPQLVVEGRASIISSGTERMLVEFGRAGMLGKARSQPDKVRQLLDKVRTDGVLPAIDAVRSKLATPIPLGYCHAGVVVDAGPEVSRFSTGDRVVSNGPHAEYVRVAETLAARIPEGVSFENAAFTPLAAIGLQGLRLANPTLGETVVVYGLGLIGALTIQLARASGCRVIGIDRSKARCELAAGFGVETVVVADDVNVVDSILALTGGIGADAVLLTLATESDEPVSAAAAMSRKRGRIVLVGVTGLSLRRDDFYKKELSFQVSCSYGPGRYDQEHEQRGRDYPLAFVRWTEGRNFEAVLGLMADGRLNPSPLITHRFPVSDAGQAYDVVASDSASLGIVLTYPEHSSRERAAAKSVTLRPGARTPGRASLGWIGAGQFSSRVLIPAFKRAGAQLEVVATSGGVSATVAGSVAGFRRATTDANSVLADPDVDTVVVATRHDSHGDWVLRALRAGKHVFCEKPLALSLEQIESIAEAAATSGRLLCVGFNRRFAPLVRDLDALTSRRSGPLATVITVNAGAIPRDHWTQDPETGGGRIVGEACHFIDLARAFANAPVSSLQLLTARTPSRSAVDDVAVIQLSFRDGSVASIQYLANGNKSFPKERVELFWDGKIAQIDNFRRVTGWGVASSRRWLQGQDKGHAALVGAFVDAVRGGAAAPIAVEEILEVSRVSVQAAALARNGGGTITFE